MKTKNIYILLAVATMIASCSQDVIEDSVFNGDEVYATLPELDYGNITRSALTYDYKEKKMHFSWDANDNIGVFAINADAGRRQQMQFKLFDGAGSLAGSFASSDADVQATIEKNKYYIAFRPYSKEEVQCVRKGGFCTSYLCRLYGIFSRKGKNGSSLYFCVQACRCCGEILFEESKGNGI